MNTMLAYLLVSTPVMYDRVDVVELNHVCSYNAVTGEYEDRLVQLIFYTDEKVIAWRMWDKTGHVFPDRTGGKYVFRFFDGKVLREIESGSFIRTRSTYDPEIEDRKKNPAADRRGLAGEQPYISVEIPSAP